MAGGGAEGKRGRVGERSPWAVGLALSGLVALSLFLGFVQLLEGLTLDQLFRYGRPDPPEASPRVVHVDIDDNALDSVGRWPWPRSRLAEAIAAIDSFGAK
ncbi:MAG: CHASE2 domain-containing protein, partial [Planctomycetota bacterium]